MTARLALVLLLTALGMGACEPVPVEPQTCGSRCELLWGIGAADPASTADSCICFDAPAPTVPEVAT